MKSLLLSMVGLLVAVSSFAQNTSVLIMSKKTGNIINGSTYTIFGDAARPEVKEEFYAVMDSQDSMLVAIKREEVSTIPGTFDYFCWFLCYGPVEEGTLPVWEAEDSLMMYRDDTISNFAAYLKPENNLGQAVYTYVFYPADNPSDSSYLDIMFDINTIGTEEYAKEPIAVYPNPASDQIQVRMSKSAAEGRPMMQLYDMQGRLVQEMALTPGQSAVQLNNNLPDGSYVVKILNGTESVHEELIQISNNK